jgi:hypothetical protein
MGEKGASRFVERHSHKMRDVLRPVYTSVINDQYKFLDLYLTLISCKRTVCLLQRDPLVQQELGRLQEAADAKVIENIPGIIDRLQVGAMRGLDVLLDILADPSTTVDMIKLKANVALELLSRTGYGPVKQIQVGRQSVSMHATLEEIEEFKRCGLKAMREAGKLIVIGTSEDGA